MSRFRHIQYLKKLKNYIILDKKIVVILALTKLFTMLLSLLPPFVYQYYINSVVMEKNIINMTYVILGYITIFIFQGIFVSFIKYFEAKYTNQIRINLKRNIFNVFSVMPFAAFEQEDIGEMRRRAEEDIEKICTFYFEHCLNFLFSIIYSISIVIILFVMNAYLILFGSVMILLSFFITRVLVEKIMSISKKYRADQGDFDSIMYDALQNWKEIKINNIENAEIELLSEKWSLLSKTKLIHTRYRFLQGAVVAFNLFFVTRMNLFFFGGLLVIYELMTVPTMLVFMNYYEQLYSNIQSVLNSMVNLGSQIPEIDNVILLLSQKEKKHLVDESLSIDDLNGDITVSNVNFKYDNAQENILKDVSIHITENHSYAIIGKSGSGKTTLVKLLVGLYFPSSGKIMLNNHDLSRVPDRLKSRYINIVMQDPQFFNISIWDNLLLAKEDAAAEEIDEVCKMANIYNFIQDLPDKYNSVIGENGIKLSGGQKQRLAIARTLLLNPKVLIFDEATSALDSENEEMIVKAIDGLSHYMTIIAISHRYTSISNCEKVILLQNGMVIEQESMNAMKNKNNTFYELFSKEIHG